MEGAATTAMTTTVKQAVEITRKPPEGSWWTKVPLCCVPLRVGSEQPPYWTNLVQATYDQK